MNIETIQNGDQVRIVLQGIVDEKGAEELKQQVARLNLDLVREVVIDCLAVRHIGSSGIGKMLLLYKKLSTTGGAFSVVNLSGPMFELFTELKLNTLFPVTQAI
ncbi:MAG: anti-anti-sigma factor [Deltaproteobacteria bacterium RIFOXYD12_FULL_55_16]|nr:MAG: anti-anti-sigma factor [Deltaproteobacteria bacterium RIFOXYD12_FULL_55_16]